MSDGEEEDFRPPRTPEPWEALTDEEDRVEENAWQQVARWSKSGKSEEDVQALIL